MTPAMCRAVAALARGLIGPLETFAGAMESEAERLDGAVLPDFVTVQEAARIIGEKRGRTPTVSTLHEWRKAGRFNASDGGPKRGSKGWLLPRSAVEAVRDGRDVPACPVDASEAQADTPAPIRSPARRRGGPRRYADLSRWLSDGGNSQGAGRP